MRHDHNLARRATHHVKGARAPGLERDDDLRVWTRASLVCDLAHVQRDGVENLPASRQWRCALVNEERTFHRHSQNPEWQCEGPRVCL